MDSTKFLNALKCRNITFLAGVPDSTFQPLYGELLPDPEFHYVPAVREDVALGVASAAYFDGKLGAVLMQNSGIGNIVNPLSSFNLMYRIPALLIVGWRGYGGSPNDAPEHWIMGEKTTEVFDLLAIPYEILGLDNLDLALDSLLTRIDEQSIPGALLVRGGVIE